MKIRTSSNQGFTLVEILIVVAIIALLASIAIPSYVRARNTSQQKACINNLRQIEGGAQTWALETRKASSDSYALDDIKPYIKLNSANIIPACPAGGTYSPGATIGDVPTCSRAADGHLVQ